jgi:hypothetical protein
MKKYIIIYYLLMFIVFTLSNCGKSEKIPKDFIQTALPKNDSNEKRELNYSKKVFSVEISENTFKIDSVTHNYYSELKIPSGTLKGKDNGEWGGKIEFISNNKNEQIVLIKEGNVKFIFQINNKIYFIEGLAHMSFNEGELFELQYSGSKFSYKSILKFEDCPEAISIYDNKIYIAGYGNFYVVDNFKKKIIFKNEFWSDLIPNSVAVVNEKEIYLGIRGGIIKLDLDKNNVLFYKYIKH